MLKRSEDNFDDDLNLDSKSTDLPSGVAVSSDVSAEDELLDLPLHGNSEHVDAEQSELGDYDPSEYESAEEDLGEEEVASEAAPWLDASTKGFLASMITHVVILVGLAIVPIVSATKENAVVITSAPTEESEPIFELVEEVAFSEEAVDNIGANSDSDTSMALSMAPVLADISSLPVPEFVPQAVTGQFDLLTQVQEAVGLVRSDTPIQGMTGVGTTGTDGAVDRITYEIMQSMEERPTLVVWLFDQSGSLLRRREEIRNRLDRIYNELGILQKNTPDRVKDDELWAEPLLTSVIAFGKDVSLLTKKPTADLSEIQSTIDSISLDDSGVERVFTAVFNAVDRFKSLRSTRGGKDPDRNVMFIVVSDERGDDATGLEATVKACRSAAIPVFVIGVPAPFGREFTYVKYIDPDPEYDQTPVWAQVDQGPESFFPERIQLGFEGNYEEEPVIDSGFGPYALSRLCYETGGIYFTVHPNRSIGRRINKNEIEPFASEINYFFDPEVMSRYRPEYVSQEDYLKRAAASPMRQVLLNAARMPRVGSLDNPMTRFVKRDEAGFVNDLTRAQQSAARLELPLNNLCQFLEQGEKSRDLEISPRWLAGYDLSYGSALAHKVRTETYNAMLAKAKRGMSFNETKNNTWILRPDDEVSVGSSYEKDATKAKLLLDRVVTEHKGTPWAVLAQRELKNPLSWKWVEEYTDLNPPAPAGPGNNNNNPPPPPQDDQARMLNQGPPKRPVPKL